MYKARRPTPLDLDYDSEDEKKSPSPPPLHHFPVLRRQKAYCEFHSPIQEAPSPPPLEDFPEGYPDGLFDVSNQQEFLE